jgi:hypothetical protein
MGQKTHPIGFRLGVKGQGLEFRVNVRGFWGLMGQGLGCGVQGKV